MSLMLVKGPSIRRAVARPASRKGAVLMAAFFVGACAIALYLCTAQRAPSPDAVLPALSPASAVGSTISEPREITVAPSPDAAMRATLAEQRELMIARLHDYWTKGEFVENPAPTGGRGHFILDGRGKPCPLASIIIESGRRDLIDQAARENNGVKVADLSDGPVYDWILNSGLTKEECVLIQQPSKRGPAAPPVEQRKDSESIASVLKRVEEQLRTSTDESLAMAVKRLRTHRGM